MGEFDDILGQDEEEIGLYEVNEDGSWKSPIARKMVEEANDKHIQEKFYEKLNKETDKEYEWKKKILFHQRNGKTHSEKF